MDHCDTGCSMQQQQQQFVPRQPLRPAIRSIDVKKLTTRIKNDKNAFYEKIKNLKKFNKTRF